MNPQQGFSQRGGHHRPSRAIGKLFAGVQSEGKLKNQAVSSAAIVFRRPGPFDPGSRSGRVGAPHFYRFITGCL
jgi:hypothetical protein